MCHMSCQWDNLGWVTKIPLSLMSPSSCGGWPLESCGGHLAMWFSSECPGKADVKQTWHEVHWESRGPESDRWHLQSA